METPSPSPKQGILRGRKPLLQAKKSTLLGKLGFFVSRSSEISNKTFSLKLKCPPLNLHVLGRSPVVVPAGSIMRIKIYIDIIDRASALALVDSADLQLETWRCATHCN
jgi:hypothetical protein